MTGLPSLSVIMPVRDEEATLDAAVASVLGQEYPTPFDIVLAVAPSTDRTLPVAEELDRRHDQVHLVTNPAGSTPAGLNAAIAAAAGDLIAR
ncbi:MAG: glycosyltransferase family 2 protein, partial [Acidimicrobiales bacterium]